MRDRQRPMKADYARPGRQHRPVCLRTLLYAALLATTLAGCSGGSNKSPPSQPEAGEWDTMVWDEGRWG